MLFDSFEAYDVQETRRISRMEGRTEGETLRLIKIVCKKIEKNCTISEIAEMLEEEEATIKKIYDVAVLYAPEYDVEKILGELSEVGA